MSEPVIAVMGTGDMGSAVGSMLRRQDYRVVTDFSGRSELSHRLARAAGMEDLGSLAAVVEAADIFLSILPPAHAFEFAEDVARLLRDGVRAGRPALLYADCNAVAPATVEAIAVLFPTPASDFLDVGIVGPAPKAGTAAPTRFYVSGPSRARLLALGVPELELVDLGESIGRASAIKMCYAGMNKGVDALLATVLLAAQRQGVLAELMQEFEASQAEAAKRINGRIPFLAATAERYVGEMQQIAAAFDAAGVTPAFHRGAEWLYARLAESSLAAESRATRPKQRPLAEALSAFGAVLDAEADHG